MASKCFLLDGGMGSQLVSNGYTDVDTDPLWSARLLSTDQAAITDVHRDFVEAGADIIETNTYQASLEGFQKYLQLSADETISLIKRSVSLARLATGQQPEGKEVLVAGSIGPRGAALHDGSEYSGDYVDNLTIEQLKDWHRPRMQALAEAGVDMFAFETIPAKKEGDALVALLSEEFPTTKAFLSFSCKNGLHTSHGELLTDAVKSGVNCSQVTHVGVNCTNPDHIKSLLDSLQIYRGVKSFVVYPNSGEMWTSGKGWDGGSKLSDIESFTVMCIERGAGIVGGCCLVTKEMLKLMRTAIDSQS